MSEIFVRLPQELQTLVEYYRGGKCINGIWKCPLNKELVLNFSKIYKPQISELELIWNINNGELIESYSIHLPINDISNQEEITELVNKQSMMYDVPKRIIIESFYNKIIRIYYYNELQKYVLETYITIVSSSYGNMWSRKFHY